MTDEERAEEYVRNKADKGNFDLEQFGKAYFSESSMKQAYLAGLKADVHTDNSKVITELKADNDARKFAMAMSEKVEKQLREENAKLKEKLKTAYRKGMRHMAKALKDYDRTDGAWTDYFEHTVDKVLQREQLDFEEYGTLAERLTKAKKIILKLYNAGRDVLMCRAEEKAYDNLSMAINDRSIEQFLKECQE